MTWLTQILDAVQRRFCFDAFRDFVAEPFRCFSQRLASLFDFRLQLIECATQRLLHPLALGDINAGTDIALKQIASPKPGDTGFCHPSELSISTSYTILHFIGLAGIKS